MIIRTGAGSYSDTWEWDGTNWLLRTPTTNPTARDGHAMTYDSSGSRVLLVGGPPYGQTGSRVQTWEYATGFPASVTKFGIGCQGSGGIPTLDAESGSLPWIGATFSARLANIGSSPTQNLPFVVLGDSKTLWNAVSLPLNLGPFGMPG